jgi:hypothetical protein
MPVPWKDVHHIPDARLFIEDNDSLDELLLVHFHAFDGMKKAGIKYEPPPAADNRAR